MKYRTDGLSQEDLRVAAQPVGPGEWVEVPAGARVEDMPVTQAVQSLRVEDDHLTVIETATTWRNGRVVDIQTTVIGRYRLEAV